MSGGSSTYQRLESDELPAGTYSIEREGSANVRLSVVVLKFIPYDTADIDPIPSDKEQGTKVLRDGRVLIIRNGAVYNVLGVKE